MKLTVETTPLERALLAAGSLRAARDTARRLWPDMDARVRNVVVTLVREGRQLEEETK